MSFIFCLEGLKCFGYRTGFPWRSHAVEGTFGKDLMVFPVVWYSGLVFACAVAVMS